MPGVPCAELWEHGSQRCSFFVCDVELLLEEFRGSYETSDEATCYILVVREWP
jgi:hypothetical protein